MAAGGNEVVLRALKVVAALLLPWVVLELGLRIAGYHAPDNRTRVLLFPNFPAFYQPDRELAWKLRPSLDWQERDMVEPFSTDPNGNRTTSSPASGNLAVDCLGNSTTFGYGARDADTYPSVLSGLLNEGSASPIVVRNLGVPGYTSHSASLIAEEQPTVAPVSIVLVGFNDHFPAHRTSETELWIRRAAYVCFASRVCAMLFDWMAKPRGDSPAQLVSYLPSVPAEDFRANLSATIRTLRERGSEPILLVYPSILSDEKTRAGVAKFWKHPRELVDANMDAHPVYQQITRDVAAAEKVRVVDLQPIFDAKGNEALHLDWVHPNPAGYRLMAESVLPAVRDALAGKSRADGPSAGAGT